MRILLPITSVTLTFASVAMAQAGSIAPMPAAGVLGPAVLVAAVGAVAGLTYLRKRGGK
ncbi:MAG: hypothetical protein MUD11_12015 [Rhodobacteraceae bacterium]|jgi:hypothetical protein|nr:hypothetical protein [Paracoccaceae bacterium]